MYLAIFVVKNLCCSFINFRRVFSKTLFSSYKNCLMYLAKPKSNCIISGLRK